MTAPGRSSRIDRVLLAVLCLLLAGAVTAHVLGGPHDAAARAGPMPPPAVDLGDGASWPGRAGDRRQVVIDGCPTPAVVEVVEPSPRGRDASLVAPDAGARVIYAYRGRILSGRLAVTALTAVHFVGRATAVLRRDGGRAWDELAVKVTLPSDCSADPEMALYALRRGPLDRMRGCFGMAFRWENPA